MWRALLAVAIGGSLAWLVPVHRAPFFESSVPDAPHALAVNPTPEATVEKTCAEWAITIEEGRAEVEAFQREWGKPIPPPPGWDPQAEEDRLKAAMDGFPSEMSAVSCELYPCAFAMILPEKPSTEALAAAFGLSEDALGGGPSQGRRSVYTVSAAVIDTSPLDEEQMLWIRRVRLRLEHDLGPERDRLLDRPEPK